MADIPCNNCGVKFSEFNDLKIDLRYAQKSIEIRDKEIEKLKKIFDGEVRAHDHLTNEYEKLREYVGKFITISNDISMHVRSDIFSDKDLPNKIWDLYNHQCDVEKEIDNKE